MSAPSRNIISWFVVLSLGLPRITASQSSVELSARAPGVIGEIRGRLVELGTGRAVTGGSVIVRRSGPDTAFVGGALLAPDGSFRIDGLVAGSYTFRVRRLGFAPLVRTSIIISAESPIVDIGILSLTPIAATLAGQVVTAERDEVTLAPDRTSYSTKNMVTASGGTAVDVLRNIPSMEVDGTNRVSLRGNENVVVQINGRSSPLHGEQLGTFLAQLPAGSLARVEVATNPSAKNDPEGTAGIINIVLKQDADFGLSGGVSAGTGTTGLANLSGNIGRRSGPLTLFASYNFYRDRRILGGSSHRTNLAVSIPAFVQSQLTGSAQPQSQSVTVRSEYRVTTRDVLFMDALLTRGNLARDNASLYSDLDESLTVIGLDEQLSASRSHNALQDYTVGYRRSIGSQAPSFVTELRFVKTDLSNDNELSSRQRSIDAFAAEHDITVGRLPSWSLQSDYTHRFLNQLKLESGLKGIRRTTSNDFTATYLDSVSGQFVLAPERATLLDYNERISAVYAVLSGQVGKMQTQGGLRLEHAETSLDIPTTAQRYDNHYASVFPSGLVSYNLTDKRQAKLSYSRRVTRPSLPQLTPILFFEDKRNVFSGNPGLRPEYTDAVELGLLERPAWGSIQVTPYVRRTAHAIRYIQRVDSTGVSLGTYDNVSSLLTMGSDLNVTYRHGPLTLLSGGSAYHFRSDAANLPGTFSARAFVWSTRVNVTWKLSPVTDGQLLANYRAAYATEGGSQNALVLINVALRHKLWGEQGSVALRITDPFNLLAGGYRTADGRVIESNRRTYGSRGVFVTISRNVGQQLKLRLKQQDPESQTSPQPGTP